MFDRFTDRARRVMGFAKTAAQTMGHDYIGTEHILLGLVQESDSIGATALKRMGVDLERVRQEIKRVVRPGSPRSIPGGLPFTPRAKKVLELSVEEAANLGNNYIGTEHLLLGLIKEREGIAAVVLRGLGLELAAVRERVISIKLGADPRHSGPRPVPSAPPTSLRPGFDRFTDRSRKVMSLAKAEAQRLNHEYIGTEHILLGLVQEGSGVAANVLKQMNIDLKRIRNEIEKIVKGSPTMVTQGNLPFTPRAKKVLELAVEEAVHVGHNYIGTEHLLLGLISEGQGIAARVLLNLGAQLEQVRAEILEFLGVEPNRVEVRAAADSVAADEHIPESDPAGIPKFTVRPSTLRIGVVGNDEIAAKDHLRAYAKWKLCATAIADLRRDAADEAAREFRIASTGTDVDALLARADVDVIDVAVPWNARAELMPKLLRAGKPVLLRKPLAGSLEEARRIVEEFERAKVPLAVNQTMRASPELHAARHLIAGGHLGTVFDLRWTMRNSTDRRAWTRGSWHCREKRFQVLFWSEHHLDAFRFLLDDEAARVYCVLPRRPDQHFVGDVCATAVLQFRNGAHVSMVDSNASTPGRPESNLLDVDGTGGSATIAFGRGHLLEYWLAKEIAGDGDAPMHRPPLGGAWIPDGFAASMAGFLEAVERGAEPPTSGRRNLGTMALVDACYRSAELGQAVDVPSVD